MPLDNILYPDNIGQNLQISINNSGPSEHIHYNDIIGSLMKINILHTGSINNILYPKDILQILTLLTSTGEISFTF